MPLRLSMPKPIACAVVASLFVAGTAHAAMLTAGASARAPSLDPGATQTPPPAPVEPSTPATALAIWTPTLPAFQGSSPRYARCPRVEIFDMNDDGNKDAICMAE
jgi:hypothetical protein